MQEQSFQSVSKASFRQPKALPFLFMTEFWERFGFYAIQTIFTLYLAYSLNMSDKQTYALSSAYTALIYISPILGGYLASSLFGYRWSVLLGNILLAVGYAALAFLPQYFIPSLVIIVLGNGFLKPNVSSFLGSFYHEKDKTRDAGFTIFYLGINIGGILATASIGYLREHWGYHSVFAVAAVGLLIGVMTFISGRKAYGMQGKPVRKTGNEGLVATVMRNPIGWLGLLVLAALGSYYVLHHLAIVHTLLNIVGVVILIGMIFLALRFQGKERKRMMCLIILILLSIVYWSIFFQQWESMALFIKRCVSKNVLGVHIPTESFYVLEFIGLLVFAPIMTWIWKKVSGSKFDMSLPTKFAVSFLIIAVSMSVMSMSVHFSRGLINGAWFIPVYWIMAISELLISPIGLAMITLLAPKKIVGFMMGVWFLGLGFGSNLAGVFADKADIAKSMTNTHAIAQVYAHTFDFLTILGLIVGVGTLLAAPMLNRLIQGDEKEGVPKLREALA